MCYVTCTTNIVSFPHLYNGVVIGLCTLGKQKWGEGSSRGRVQLGEKAVLKLCSACHSSRPLLQAELTRHLTIVFN